MGLFNDLFGNGSASRMSRPMPSGGMGSSNRPSSSSSGRVSFENGVFKGGFDPNMRYRVSEDLYGTISSHDVRHDVANLFYESRGGSGVTKDELRSGLRRLVREGKMNEKQMWAVRGKYNL